MQHKRYKRHGFCHSRYSNSHLAQGDAITFAKPISESLEVLICTTAKSLIFPPTARFLREHLRRFVPHFGLLAGRISGTSLRKPGFFTPLPETKGITCSAYENFSSDFLKAYIHVPLLMFVCPIWCLMVINYRPPAPKKWKHWTNLA